VLKTTVVGSYPRLSSNPADVNIRRLLHRFDKGKISEQELDEAFAQVSERVIREQLDARIDLPTDGQIRWDDIVTPLAAAAAGFEIGGLIRWFDNNVYYRKPQIVGRVEWKAPITVDNYLAARRVAGREVKAVLAGPFSLMALSDDRHYKSSKLLLKDLTALLHKEAEALVAAGASEIQFDEPSLQYHPDQIEAAAAAFNEVVSGLSASFWLCTYFGSVKEIAAKAKLFNVQVLAADCVSRPENFDYLLDIASDCNVCFGLLDARNIKLENPDALQRQLAGVREKFPDAYVSPSCGLEFLPHRDAQNKMKLLVESVKRFEKGL
jgi:5-methyltetrahydropteroyltriglutamate--homocysteine methyltransferase